MSAPLLNVMKQGFTDQTVSRSTHTLCTARKSYISQHSASTALALSEPYCTILGILGMHTGLHCVGSIAFQAVTHITLCNPCVIYQSGGISRRLQSTAGLVGAVIVVATVHVPLPQLPSSRLVLLLTAAAVAVAVVGG